MGKSRTEIQRNYREKEEDKCSKLSRKRTKISENIQNSSLSIVQQKTATAREKNKEYCKKYRESKKKINNSVLPPICILEDSTPSN